MACPAVLSGQQFLQTALAHVDCQAQTIGSYGYAALADPGSPASLALGALLTVFVAVFGIRLLTGEPMGQRDLIADILRVGIVLTLATSWPAWRVVGYDLLIRGPSEIASAIGFASALPGSGHDLVARLQLVDNGLSALNTFGSGRLGVAQGDWFQLGLARTIFLIGTLGPVAIVRLSAGILLALAPMIAGMLLFGVTRPLFSGWIRGMIATFLGSVALSIVLSVQLAITETWLAAAIGSRGLGQQVLDVPFEAVALCASFAFAALALLVVSARVAFNPSLAVLPATSSSIDVRRDFAVQGSSRSGSLAPSGTSSRETRIAMSFDENAPSERTMAYMRSLSPQTDATGAANRPATGEPPVRIGTSYRRSSNRISRAATRRDKGV